MDGAVNPVGVAAGAGAGAAAVAKTDAVAGEATTGDRGERGFLMEATVVAARARTYHATCSTVSCRRHFCGTIAVDSGGVGGI